MLSDATTIAVLSDIEGSSRKLDLFCQRHPAFVRGADGLFHLAPGASFVHAGDVPDRFEGTQAAVAELIRLKAEAPDRVLLVAGNRDVNKLRLTAELSREGLKAPPPVRAADWKEWLAKQASARSGKPAGELTAADLALGEEIAVRLRWILERTMGAPDGFEMRRREMARRGEATDDNAVAASFVAELSPGGPFRKLLAASTLLARRGNTIFAHAGITDDNIGFVPGEADRATGVDEWIAALDRWYRAELAAWERDAFSWDGSGPRPGERLIRYAEPVPGKPANATSVVYCRSVDEQGKIALPGKATVEWLAASGVTRLVIGHTPSGELPVVLRTADDGFEVVVADTSRAGEMETPALISLEGDGLASVLVQGQLTLRGARRQVAFRSRMGLASPLGKRTATGALVVAPGREGLYTYQLAPGWKIIYDIVEGPASGAPGLEPVD